MTISTFMYIHVSMYLYLHVHVQYVCFLVFVYSQLMFRLINSTHSSWYKVCTCMYFCVVYTCMFNLGSNVHQKSLLSTCPHSFVGCQSQYFKVHLCKCILWNPRHCTIVGILWNPSPPFSIVYMYNNYTHMRYLYMYVCPLSMIYMYVSVYEYSLGSCVQSLYRNINGMYM